MANSKTFLIISLLIFGCGVSEKVVIEDRIIKVLPPTIHDTLYITKIDSIFTVERIVNRDTLVFIKIDTILKKVIIRIKPDTLRIVFRDTTIIYKREVIIKGMSLTEKLGYGVWGVVVFIIVFLVIKFTFK